MTYKRYIKKNGKIYGSYHYSSAKKEGKVVSKYLGKEGSVKESNLGTGKILKLVFLFAFLALGFLSYLHLSGEISLTGNSIKDINQINEKNIEGEKKLIYKNIEVVPYSDNETQLSNYRWIVNDKTKEFYPDPVEEITAPLKEFHWKVSALETEKDCTQINPFFSLCQSEELDFSDFESINNITKKEISTVNDENGNFLYYLVSYYGQISNLDPYFQLDFSSSSTGFFNQTQATSSGINLSGTNTSGDFKYFVHYNSTPTYWNTTLWHNSTINLETRTSNEYNLSDSSLAGFWSFNSNESSNLTDEMGNNNGTCLGGNCPTWNDSYGAVGGGYFFDGVDDGIDLGDNYDFTGQNFTVCAWARPRSAVTNDNQYVIGKFSGTNGLFLNRVGDDFWSVGTTGAGSMRFYDVDIDEWQHLCAAISPNPENSDLYKNGVLVNSSSLPDITDNAGSMVIGNRYSPSDRQFNGSIDEVRIYDRELSSSEVLDLYEMGSSYINWSSFDNEGSATSGTPITSTSNGTFFQYKAGFSSSGYLFNHSVGSGNTPSEAPETTPPNVTINSPSNDTLGNLILFNVTATDSTGVDSCWFTLDSGVTNVTLEQAGTTDYYNFTNSSVPDGGYTAQFYCNDSTNTINNTESIVFTVDEAEEDTTSPLWFDNSTNSTFAGQSVEHRVRWTEDSGLSGYIFSFDNGTGTFVNDSFVEMSGTSNWSNVTKVVNSTVDSTIRWRVYSNDSNNNFNVTDIFQYVTSQDTTPPTFTTIPSDDSITYGTDWTGVDFDATDETSFDSFSVNDTRFTINSTGFLDEVSSLGAGGYSLNITINDSSGNENSTLYTLTVNTATPTLNLDANNVTYPSDLNILANESNSGDSDLTYTLYIDGVQQTTGSSIDNDYDLGAGNYTIVYNTTGGTNYSSASSTIVRSVSLGTLSGSLVSSSGSFSVDTGTAVNISFSESNVGDSDVNYTIYNESNYILNNTQFNSSSAANYTLVLNSTGGANYSSISQIDLEYLVYSEPQDTSFDPTYTMLAYEFTNTSNITDLSGHGHTGTTSGFDGDELVASGGFDGGSYFEFDGANDYVNASDSFDIYNSQNMTFALWVRINDTNLTSNQYALAKVNGTGGTSSYAIYANTTSDLWYFRINGFSSFITTQINYTNWTHIVGTVNTVEDRHELYINGQIQSSRNPDPSIQASTTSSVIVGARNQNTGGGSPLVTEYFQGDIESVQIYNVSFSEEEILELYENETAGSETTPPSITINSPTNTTYLTSSILFNVTATDSTGVDSCWYTLDSGLTNQTLTRDGSTNYYNFTNSSVPDGGYTAQFYCNDTLSNINNTESVVFTINTSLIAIPTIAINSPSNGTSTTDATPEINFTSTDDISTSINYSVFVDGSSNGQTGNVSNNTATLLNLSALSEAVHEIIVQVTDEDENSANSTGLTITVDNTNPSVTLNTSLNGTLITDTTPQINFTITDNLDSNITYDIFVDGSSNGQTGNVSNNTATLLNVSTLANGTHTIIFQGTDNAGNSGNSTELVLDVDDSNQCFNGILDGNEVAVDCGGSCSDCSLTGNLTAWDSSETGRPYYAYTPSSFNDSRVTPYPALIFLRGQGQVGTDLTLLVSSAEGLIYEINNVTWPPDALTDSQKAVVNDMIIFGPQDWTNGNFNQDELNELITLWITKYNLDEDKIFLTGLSAGASGVYNYIDAYPGVVSGIIPISGNSAETDDGGSVCRFSNMSIWAFHGANDSNAATHPTNSVFFVENVNDCNPAPNRTARLTLYPDCGHSSCAWQDTYDLDNLNGAWTNETNNFGSPYQSEDAGPYDQDIYTWLLEHTSTNDTTSPTFTTIPANASITYGNSLEVDFDATDETSFDSFAVNDSRFAINSTGFLSNNSQLGVAVYLLNITINDSSNNVNSTIYQVTVTQAVPIGSISGTSTITYGTAADVNGSESNIGDSDLTYNLYRDSVAVSNPDTSTLAAGSYNYIYNVTSGTNYTANSSLDTFALTVNQNSESCQVNFNTSSGITYPTTFLVSSNCTSDFTLYRNGSSISNNSEQALAAGTYNFTVIRTDSSNYSEAYDEETFTVNQATLSASLVSSEGFTINVGTPTNIFHTESNSGDSDVNYTIYLDSSYIVNNTELNEAIGNYTIILNSTGGVNYSSSSQLDLEYLVFQDVTNPSITLNNPVNTYNSTSSSVEFAATISDDVEVDTVQLYGNFSGTWELNSTNSSGVNNSQYNFTLSLEDGNYIWGYYANDTSGNENVSSNRTLLVDATAPAFTDLENQTFAIGTSLSYDINATDSGVGVDSFSIDDTTNFTINSSTGVISNNTGLNAEFYYTINVSVNDTLGNLNWGVLGINVTNDTQNPSITINAPSGTLSSTNVTINISFSDDIGLSVCNYNITDSSNTEVIATNTISCANNSVEYQTISAGSNYVLTAFANDSVGNSNVTNTTFSISISSGDSGGDSGSSGGGGGGGSSTTTTTTTNTSNTTSGIVASNSSNTRVGTFSIKTENTTKVQIKNPESSNNSIVGVNFDLTEERNETVVITEEIGDFENTEIVSGETVKGYAVFEINHENISDSEIENVTIEFKVNKSWVENKDVNPLHISLYRLKDSWTELQTNLTEENNENYFYQSLSPGLSTFFVGVNENKVLVEEKSLWEKTKENILKLILKIQSSKKLMIILGSSIVLIIIFIMILVIRKYKTDSFFSIRGLKRNSIKKTK